MKRKGKVGRPKGSTKKKVKPVQQQKPKVVEQIEQKPPVVKDEIQNTVNVKSKLVSELKDVSNSSEKETTLKPGNEMEQEILAADAELNKDIPTPDVNTDTDVDVDTEKPKHKRRGRPTGSTKHPLPPEHNEDVIGVMLEGSVIPAIAWKAKVPIEDLMDTEREKQMLMNIMPEDSPLRRKSWGIYIVVRGCLLVGKTLRAKLKQMMGKEKYEKIFGKNGEIIPNTEQEKENEE